VNNEGNCEQRVRFCETIVAALGMIAVLLTMIWVLLSDPVIRITLGTMALVSAVWLVCEKLAGRSRR
jgi:hypothetical protein